MSDGPDLGGEEVMTPEQVAARRRQVEASEAVYRARFGDAPLEPGDISEEKWRTPVDFRVVRRADDPDDADADTDEAQ